MKISYNWLKELVPELQLSPREVAELLTMHSFETVEAKRIGIDKRIRVAKIINIQPHPNADRLQLATVEVGGETTIVVCGAPNIAVGQLVPYAPPGAELYDEEGQVFTVKEATIRGVSSPGMLNSLRELGLSDTHAGVWVLPPDTPVGSRLAELVPVDTVLEADITPNRAPDGLSMIGLAREVAALVQLSVVEPSGAILPQATSEVAGFSLQIEDAQLTPRYMNVLLSDIGAGSTPLWMQLRLLAMGSRPLSPVIDVTNYVMFEQGNPTHAFDAQKLPGKVMGVRAARRDEALQLLDGSEHTVPAGALLITSDDQPIALAGIMGGAGSEVSDRTTSLVLEAANFQPYAIQKTAAALHLYTDAAARFLKGIEPDRALVAASRVAALLHDITGATIRGVLDFYPAPPPARVIPLSPARVAALAGAPVEATVARSILERLRCEVRERAASWEVTPPADRLDLMGEHDLIEEVLRVVGFAQIPAAADAASSPPVPLPHELAVREVVRDSFVKQGFTETYNYSFSVPRLTDLLELSSAGRLEVVNPISPEQKFLRTSLVPGLLANFVKNKAEFTRAMGGVRPAVFEIGHVYREGKGGRVEGVQEVVHLAAMMIGTGPDITAAVTQMLKDLGVTQAPTTLGGVTELSAEVLRRAKFSAPLVYVEWNLEDLVAAAPRRQEASVTLAEIQKRTPPVQFTALPKFPAVFRDVSVLVDPDVTVEHVEAIIERVGGKLVAEVELFDVYDASTDSTATVSTPQKSLSFHVRYQADDRTLTAEEIAAHHNAILATLHDELGAAPR